MIPAGPIRELRRWMDEHQVTQAEVSRSTGLHYSHISLILSGRRGITVPTAMRLAGFTGIPVEKLVNHEKVLVVRTSGAVS